MGANEPVFTLSFLRIFVKADNIDPLDYIELIDILKLEIMSTYLLIPLFFFFFILTYHSALPYKLSEHSGQIL